MIVWRRKLCLHKDLKMLSRPRQPPNTSLTVRKSVETISLVREQTSLIRNLVVSHEMRNPLSAIFQCTDEILETIQTHVKRSDPPSMTVSQLRSLEEAAHTIALCAQHQSGIFNDILTVSKLDSQLLTILPEKVRAVDIVPVSYTHLTLPTKRIV